MWSSCILDNNEGAEEEQTGTILVSWTHSLSGFRSFRWDLLTEKQKNTVERERRRHPSISLSLHLSLSLSFPVMQRTGSLQPASCCHGNSPLFLSPPPPPPPKKKAKEKKRNNGKEEEESERVKLKPEEERRHTDREEEEQEGEKM